MKKLMFALVAGVAATVATAAPITQADFEELAAGATVGVATNAAEDTWVGKFAYAPASEKSENTSTVAVYSVDAAYAGDRNAVFSGTNEKYLDLSTDDGILYSTINGRSAGNPFGAEKTVTSSLYIDTLVQFTACDTVQDIDSSAKLAIWLQTSDDEATTNLMVRAKTYAISGDSGSQSFDGEVTNFVIGAANAYQAGTWYRLTVEAVPNVFTSTKGAAGFKIRINGNYVKADRAAFTGSTALVENMVADYKGLINANDAEATIFLPINGSIMTAAGFESSPLTLCAVGFSGTGAVDDILFTEDNPFFTAPTVIDFTIALAANASVAYSFTSNAVEYAGNITAAGNTVLRVPVGATVSLTPTAATDSLGWNTYSATVANPVNANFGEPTVAGTTNVTIASTFTQEMQGQASVEVNVTATTVTKDNAAFAGAAWNTGSLTAETFASLVTWASAKGYSTSRVANYPYALERMAKNAPIEVLVALNVNGEVVTGYDASLATVTPPEGDEYVGATCYSVDAGMPLVLSNFVFATSYRLNADTTDPTWAYSETITAPDGFSSLTVADGVVTFTPAIVDTYDYAVECAFSGIGYGTIPSYTIKFISGEGDSQTNEVVVQEGETPAPSVAAAAIVGKTFTGWSPTIVAAEANATYTAQYSVNTYAITFVYGESSSSDNVAHGVVPTAPTAAAEAAAPAGKHFTGWDKTIVAATEATTYTAQYDWNTYTVTFNKNNESATGTMSDQTFTYNVAQGITSNAFELSDYTFAGWATAADGEVVYADGASLTLTDDSITTLYAKWTQDTPAVEPIDPSAAGGGEETYADAAAAAAAADAINADKATNIPLPASIKDGLSSEQKTAYYASVQAVADGTKVTVAFTSAGETAAQTSADAAATTAAVDAAVTAAAAAGASGSGTASVPNSLPGLYYSILSGTSPDAVTTEGDRVLGTGGAINLTVPNKGTAGFYKVKVSPTNK